MEVEAEQMVGHFLGCKHGGQERWQERILKIWRLEGRFTILMDGTQEVKTYSWIDDLPKV